MLKKWKNISTEILNKNPWTQFRHDRFELPNGKQGDYFYMHSNGAVAIIPMKADGKLVANKQYRYLFDRESIEFPSGGGLKILRLLKRLPMQNLQRKQGMHAKN